MNIELLRDKRLYVIFSITLIAVMGVASITPALPKISHTLNLNKSQIALLISAFTFPGIFITPVTGILADRWGRKMVLTPSLFIFGISGFSIFFVHDFHYIIILRVIQGVGAASLSSINTTLIADYFKGKQRPEAMGYNASVLSLSTATYPLLGGVLAGMAWYYPFIMPLLAIPVGLFVIYGIEEPQIAQNSSFKTYLKDISISVFRKEVIAIFILSILTFIILYGALLTYLPFLLDQTFNFKAPQIGIVFFISSLATAIFATQVGNLTIRFGSISILKTAFVLYLIVMLFIPIISNIYLFIIPIILFGIAQALNIPSLQTVMANLAPEDQRGAFLSLNGMVLRLGQTLGPLIIGIGYSIGGLNGSYLAGAAIAFMGIIVLFIFFNQRN